MSVVKAVALYLLAIGALGIVYFIDIRYKFLCNARIAMTVLLVQGILCLTLGLWLAKIIWKF